jgi:hypothetical protein
MGTPVTRWTHVWSRTTCAAPANARSVSDASPAFTSTQTFDATSSYRTGALSAAAATLRVTAGRALHSISTFSAPSRAAAGVSAITIATISPTKRTRSAGITGCGAMKRTSSLRMISS